MVGDLLEAHPNMKIKRSFIPNLNSPGMEDLLLNCYQMSNVLGVVGNIYLNFVPIQCQTLHVINVIDMVMLRRNVLPDLRPQIILECSRIIIRNPKQQAKFLPLV